MHKQTWHGFCKWVFQQIKFTRALEQKRKMKPPPGSTWVQFLKQLTGEIDSIISLSGKHSVKVANWGKLVAERIGIIGDELQTVYWGAMFHDVGKIGIPKDILGKDGPLTHREWTLMEMHPTIGANIVTATQSFAAVVPIIEAHQERFDGKGYPGGIYGKSIPIGARILAVVDAYDAMTDTRPYRDASSHTDAISEITQLRGRQFDPKVVDAFIDILAEERKGD